MQIIDNIAADACDWRREQAFQCAAECARGPVHFNENWTRERFNRSGGGDSIASMMLGLVQGGRIQQEPALALTVPYSALYVQDDWRMSDRLTLNLGLRWDSSLDGTARSDFLVRLQCSLSGAAARITSPARRTCFRRAR